MTSNFKPIAVAVVTALSLSSCAITQSVEENKETVIAVPSVLV